MNCVTINSAERQMGDWLRGRAYPSHGWGHKFESCIAHHRILRPRFYFGLFLFRNTLALVYTLLKGERSGSEEQGAAGFAD